MSRSSLTLDYKSVCTSFGYFMTCVAMKTAAGWSQVGFLAIFSEMNQVIK